jgi:hypothetical protein
MVVLALSGVSVALGALCRLRSTVLRLGNVIKTLPRLYIATLEDFSAGVAVRDRAVVAVGVAVDLVWVRVVDDGVDRDELA